MTLKRTFPQFAAALIFVAVCACSCTSAPTLGNEIPSPQTNRVYHAYDGHGLRAAIFELYEQDSEYATIRVMVRKDNEKPCTEFRSKDITLPETYKTIWGIDHVRYYHWCPIGEKDSREFVLVFYTHGWGCGSLLGFYFGLAIIEINDNDANLVFNDDIGGGMIGHSLYEKFGYLRYSMSVVDIASQDGKIMLTILDREGDEITGIRKYVLGEEGFVPMD